MRVKLHRTYFNAATMGHLWIADLDDPVFYTIERPWLNNKVNVSCIPAGNYNVKPYSSDKFKDVYEVQDVPDRSKILIHVANWATEVEGCIGIGLSAGYMMQNGLLQKSVTGSRIALSDFKKLLGYQGFILSISGELPYNPAYSTGDKL